MLTTYRCRLAAGRSLFTALLLLSAFAMTSTAQLNYDTAWTYVYDGGIYKDIFNRTYIIDDYFRDVKVLPDGRSICVGQTRDSTGLTNVLLMKLDASGAMMWKKLYRYQQGGGGYSVIIAKNGDFIIGGVRYNDPLIIRTDTLGNVKWSSWYYDSINDQHFLLSNAIVNSVRENRRGGIVCAVGDEYPDNGGSALNNYATYLELDSAGQVVMMRQWNNSPVCNIAGFDIEEAQTGQYFLSGNEGVYTLDSNGGRQSAGSYSFYLTGVGTVVNRVNRVKILRSGTPIVAGMAYEGNCWTNYNQLYYDAWWSPISGGTRASWDTAGMQGANDYLYDFTQLVNGNLVFVGKNGNTAAGGVWAIVTDSTGKNLLWEKQFRIPYRSADGRAPRPLSVCATSDTGFTVVGDYQCVDSLGAKNAFAAHFVIRTAAPALVSPIASANNQPVSLTLIWNRVTGATNYDLQVATNSSFTALFADDSLLTDSLLVVSGLANGTNYYWRVRARGAYGTSAWSVYRRFTTIVAAPATPTLASPSDGAIDQLSPVTVVWSSVTGATSYHVQVATDTGFTSIFLRDSSLAGTQRVVNGLANGTQYYWRVRAKNVGGVSGWSTVWDFTTSTPPGTPVLVSPANGATSQPTTLTLVWTTSSNAVTYHLQVATDIGFTSIFAQDSLLTDSQLVVSGLSNSTSYYWRVRAKNSGGIVSNWASYRSFTTIVTVPLSVVIVSPADSTVIVADSAQLRWNTGTPSVDRYLVEVATDTNMTVLVVSDSSVTDTSRSMSSLVNNTTYFWRVKAHNAAGWGSFSNETRFVTSFTGVLYNGNSLKSFSLRYSSGTLHYTLPTRSFVSVRYYDIRGRMVGSFVNTTQGGGNYSLVLPVSSWSTGAYVQVFEAGDVVRKDRVMVVK